MKPERLNLQYKANVEHPDAVRLSVNDLKWTWSFTSYQIVGSKFERDPPESTVRYTNWANSITPEQLNQQVLTSHGPTIIMPTWFCSRETFNRCCDILHNIIELFPLIQNIKQSWWIWWERQRNTRRLDILLSPFGPERSNSSRRRSSPCLPLPSIADHVLDWWVSAVW